uniref:CD109 molecule n=1 Tax=Cyprinodon variegatus TaxID=28743 RepID=A0A3Q2E7E9_CYPVA
MLTPAALRTGLPTSVAVTVLGSSSVTVSAEIYQEQGGVLSKNSTVVKGGGSGIKEAESGARSSYTLKVKGHRGSVQIFSNSTQLQVQPGGVSTFIQTDKRSYQPGQAVKIRAVSVLSDGKPCVGPADILIRDNLKGFVSARWDFFFRGFNPISSGLMSSILVLRYWYGKPVHGHMNITVSLHSHGNVYSHSKEAEVTSRGQVVSAGRSSGYLTLVPEVSWAPMAKIIVYCVHLSGEVINDVIHLPIARFLQNKLDVLPPLLLLTFISWTAEEELVHYLQVDGEHHQEQPEPHKRENFPETWVWMEVNTGASVGEEISLTVPDSITTWTASAFVMSQDLGLGVTEKPAELTVFQDFFLSLNLPACITRGEELVLEVVLFNYLQEDLEVTPLKMRTSSTFDALFTLRPVSFLYQQPVLCFSSQAEGVPQTFSSSMLFHLSADQTSLSRDVSFSFPPGVVEGSERVSLTAIGDILGPSISGLDSLIQMPYGCGEQNMIHFAPNIYVLQYLIATGQVDPDLTRRATDYMIKGYEQQLSYQRADGSFSAFGEQDSSGSTWLSAFVLRCFLQARPFISMDDHVLQRAAAWVAMQQGADGRMLEPGRVIHTELQGGLDGPVSLTSYVLIALLEDDSPSVLERLVNYSLSLLTYALALAGSPASLTALNQLIGRAEIRGLFTGSGSVSLSSSWQPRSANIEMVSYVLLSLHKLNQVPDGLSLMKWLSQQRNHLGGYGSTQDTVVALQALSTFAPLGISHHSDINIRVDNRDSDSVASFHINKDNFLLLQSTRVSAPPAVWSWYAALSFFPSLAQLNVFYNIRTEELMRKRRDTHEDEAFHLYVDLFDSEENHASLHVCRMVLMEVGLLSGFSLRPDLIELDGALKKVETQPGKVVLYLDSVTTHETCVSIPLILEFMVAKVQEATVTIYDYYEPREPNLCRILSLQKLLNCEDLPAAPAEPSLEVTWWDSD